MFFHAYVPPQNSEYPTSKTERICLELRADSVQPARIQWIIEIRPILDLGSKPGSRRIFSEEEDSTRSETILEAGDSTPKLDFRFPIIILVVVLISIIFMLFCRNNKTKEDKKEMNDKNGVNNEESPTLDGISSPLMRKRHFPDLDDIARIKSNNEYGSDLETSSQRTSPTRGTLIFGTFTDYIFF